MVIAKAMLVNVLAFLIAAFPLPVAGTVVSTSGVDTDPLNLDSQVRQAFDHFYILDYDGALSRFEKIQTAHPDSPLAVDFVLDAVLFRELYLTCWTLPFTPTMGF